MDVGVGTYIAMGALAAAHSSRDEKARCRVQLVLGKVVLLLFLAFARMLSVKAVGYQVGSAAVCSLAACRAVSAMRACCC